MINTDNQLQTGRLDISIVAPAFNEENSIVRTVEEIQAALEELKIAGEIIIVDDCSRDSTGSKADELSSKYSNVKVCHHEKNLGVGGAYCSGVKLARGKAVTMLPGDGENYPHEILQYLPLLEYVDIAVPYVFNKEERSFFRRFVSTAYTVIISCSFRISLSYTNGTVLYRKEIADMFLNWDNSFFFQTEILVRCLKAGILFAQVPCRLASRRTGKSSAVSFKSLKNVIRGYVRLLVKLYVFRFRDILDENIKFPKNSMTAVRRSYMEE